MSRDAETELADQGFRWDRFREIFPFGATEYGEGRYQRLVSEVLKQLPNDRQREMLMALLDVQAAAFLEQAWVQNEFFEAEEDVRFERACAEFSQEVDVHRYRDAPERRDPPFMMAAHYASAWLQINDNLRGRYGLRSRGGRAAMLKLGAGEFLADRIFK